MSGAPLASDAAPARRPCRDPRDVPLLVLSFDGYEDVWPPFFSFFWKHWPDCPFRVHLVTNSKIAADPRVTTLATGPEVSWATRVRRALETVNSEYVLIVLDDFLIYERVNTAEVLRLASVALEEHAGCLRLAPNPPPSAPVPGHPDLGAIVDGDPYRITSQVAFWHTDTLLEFLQPHYSIWDFEFHASIHGPTPKRPLWARWRPAIVYRDCISRGKWMPWGLATCRRAGVAVNSAARARITGRALWQMYYGRVRGAVFWSLPRKVQRRRWRRIVDREMAKRAAV